MSQTERNLFVQRLCTQIYKDQEFRCFHQTECQKGVFRFIKSTFEDMLQLLKNYSDKQRPTTEITIEETLEGGGKVFAYYQYKLFTWISAWVIHRNKIDFNQIHTVSLSILEHFFKNKHPSVIRYEFFLVLSLIRKVKRSWSARQNRFLEQQMIQLLPFDSHNDPKINWKIISYRMFAQGLPPRTPHQCRERWINHINPDIRKSKWSNQEDIQLLTLYEEYGPKWSFLAKLITNRNEHMIKNRLNSIRAKWLKRHQTQHFVPATLIKELLTPKEPTSTVALRSKKKKNKPKETDLIELQQGLNMSIEKKSKLDKWITLQSPEPLDQQPMEKEPLAIQSISCNSQKAEPLTKVQVQEDRSELEHCVYSSQSKYEWMSQEYKFSSEDYEWVDRLIQSQNLNWLELENF